VFWVIYEDSSVVVVPSNSNTVVGLPAVKWPVKPVQIHTHLTGVLVNCEHSHVCYASLAKDSLWCPIPKAPQASSSSDQLLRTSSRGHWAAALYVYNPQSGSGDVTTQQTPKKGRGKATAANTSSASASSSNAVKYAAVACQVNDSSEPTWVNTLGNKQLTSHYQEYIKSSNDVNVSASVVGFGILDVSNATYAIIANVSTQSTEPTNNALLIKSSFNGDVLYTRAITGKSSPPRAVNNIRHHLWMVFDDCVSCWDERYGVPLANFPTYSHPTHSLRHEHVVATIVPSASNSRQFIYLCCHAHDSCTVVMKSAIHTNIPTAANSQSVSSTQASSLMNILGRLASTVATTMESEPTASGTASTKKRRASSRDATKDDVLGAITSEVTVVVDGIIEAHKAASTQGAGSHHDHHHRASVDAVMSVTEAATKTIKKFLRAFEKFLQAQPAATANSQTHASQWDAAKKVLTTGVFSVSAEYAGIVAAALNGCRLDVVMHIAAYDNQLSESLAVSLLNYVVSLTPEVVAAWTINDDGKCVLEDKSSSTSAAQSATATPSKRTRKVRSASEDLTASQADGSSNQRYLQLLNALITALVNRRQGFSKVLLTEALNSKLSPNFAIFLLHSLSHRLNTNNSVATSSRQSSTNDGELKRIVSWMECILDAHMSAIAINAQHNEHTRKVLASMLSTQAASTTASMLSPAMLEDNIDTLEELSGVWQHIVRMNNALAAASHGSGTNKHGHQRRHGVESTAVKNALSSLYSVDKLMF
jgi:hypothetical protein